MKKFKSLKTKIILKVKSKSKNETVLYLILSYLSLLTITTTLNEELQGYLSGVGAGGLCYSFRKIENRKYLKICISDLVDLKRNYIMFSLFS